MPDIYWLRKGDINLLINKIFLNLYQEFKLIFGKFFAPGISFLTIVLLILIFINNRLGLLPYVFTSTRHLSCTLSLAFPLWIGHLVKAWITTPNKMLAHLVPLGTPIILAPFIVIIEIVRRLIRPITLSVRLAANIMAGHLLLTLLTQGASRTTFSILFFIIIGVVFLAILETAVRIIQAYVFRILITLYLEEVNSKELIIGSLA